MWESALPDSHASGFVRGVLVYRVEKSIISHLVNDTLAWLGSIHSNSPSEPHDKMKLSSLLFGDLADLFQDDWISGVEASVSTVRATACHNSTQIARLAQTVERRIREVEAENTLLSMLLVGVLKCVSQSHPAEMQKIVDEISEVLRSGESNSPDLLRKLLEIPVKPRTPICDYTKPSMAAKPKLPKHPIPKVQVKRPMRKPSASDLTSGGGGDSHKGQIEV